MELRSWAKTAATRAARAKMSFMVKFVLVVLEEARCSRKTEVDSRVIRLRTVEVELKN